MSGNAAKTFNLPWHQQDHYWIGVYAKGGDLSAGMVDMLQKAGFQKLAGGMFIQTNRDWKSAWYQVYGALEHAGALDAVEVSLLPGAEAPHAKPECKPAAFIQMLADSMWVGDALLENRLVCYLQPVMNGADKIFGYESFARIKNPDGTIIGGEQIIAASKVLGIEHLIDRHLHAQAIRTFVSSEFNGFLFVNFFPGFIHRPAVYLERLSETAKSFGVIAKNIVLDFTRAETPRDILHLKSVCEYGRSRGYSIALDDIVTVEGAHRLINEIRPDFVKIDFKLVSRAGDSEQRDIIREIVELAHAAHSTVIAEGVESKEIHKALRKLGVDLFQGYLFSPPVPVEAVLKRDRA